jgi:hypothetical protein
MSSRHALTVCDQEVLQHSPVRYLTQSSFTKLAVWLGEVEAPSSAGNAARLLGLDPKPVKTIP